MGVLISLVVAAATNNGIGKDGKMPWHLPNDMKHFKNVTWGMPIVMGRKTFESFPKPLPNRTHIIITRQKDYEAPEGCLVASSLKKAIDLCPKEEEVFIIGGGEIYKQSIEIADKIDLTRVHTTIEADTFFPEINPEKWKLLHSEKHSKDERHLYDYSFESYSKI